MRQRIEITLRQRQLPRGGHRVLAGIVQAPGGGPRPRGRRPATIGDSTGGRGGTSTIMRLATKRRGDALQLAAQARRDRVALVVLRMLVNEVDLRVTDLAPGAQGVLAHQPLKLIGAATAA